MFLKNFFTRFIEEEKALMKYELFYHSHSSVRKKIQKIDDNPLKSFKNSSFSLNIRQIKY